MGGEDFPDWAAANEAIVDETVLEEQLRAKTIHLAGKILRTPSVQAAARVYLREVVRVARTFSRSRELTIKASESAAELGVTWAIDDWKKEGR